MLPAEAAARAAADCCVRKREAPATCGEVTRSEGRHVLHGDARGECLAPGAARRGGGCTPSGRTRQSQVGTRSLNNFCRGGEGDATQSRDEK